jgi:hypothetical protein
LQEKKNCDVNIISTVVLRGIWLTRNDLIFHNQVWLDVKTILRRMLRLIMEWSITFKDMIKVEDGEVVFLLNKTDPRAIENCKWMKAMLGDTINRWK